MTAQLEEKNISCPYCGEPITVLVDTSVAEQDYIEDCSVCCQPIELRVVVDNDDCYLQAHTDSD